MVFVQSYSLLNFVLTLRLSVMARESIFLNTFVFTSGLLVPRFLLALFDSIFLITFVCEKLKMHREQKFDIKL